MTLHSEAVKEIDLEALRADSASTLKVCGDGRGHFESGDDCNRFRAALARVQRSDDKGDAT